MTDTTPRGLRPDSLARVLHVIDMRIHEPLPVEELAKHAFLSPFHFARMFKQSTGVPPHAYLTRRRMELARRLLAESSMPIGEVARNSGFRTQAHFSGVFRTTVGMTPGRFRREQRSGAVATSVAQ